MRTKTRGEGRRRRQGKKEQRKQGRKEGMEGGRKEVERERKEGAVSEREMKVLCTMNRDQLCLNSFKYKSLFICSHFGRDNWGRGCSLVVHTKNK